MHRCTRSSFFDTAQSILFAHMHRIIIIETSVNRYALHDDVDYDNDDDDADALSAPHQSKPTGVVPVMHASQCILAQYM